MAAKKSKHRLVRWFLRRFYFEISTVLHEDYGKYIKPLQKTYIPEGYHLHKNPSKNIG